MCSYWRFCFVLVLCFHYCKIDDCCCFICKKVNIVNFINPHFFQDFHLFFFGTQETNVQAFWMVVNQHWFLATLECDFPDEAAVSFGWPLVGNEGNETPSQPCIVVSFPHSLLRATHVILICLGDTSFVEKTQPEISSNLQELRLVAEEILAASRTWHHTWRWIMNHFWYWIFSVRNWDMFWYDGIFALILQ